MTPDEIDALTFDVFGTVVDWRGGIIRDGTALGAKHGLAVDWGHFADAWRGLYQPLLGSVRDGRRPWVPLDQLHREGLLQVLAQFGIHGLDEAEIADFVRVWHRLDPWPDAVAALTRLKRRYVLATLSNGNVRLTVNMAKRAGLPWDAVLGAEVAHAYKPMPEAYLATARLLDVPPGRCLMVAAHYSDLVAACGQGFRTCYVWRRAEYGTGEKHDLPDDHGLDLVVEDFGELADRLGV
ncbi:haloacid dehalogenase [Aliidongia dinghuensis]|uniref:(S)-2-haloacid dehalogenase n=1 Tax=Aliidongia dinghuensis TaxID=1867774 RepID=A0A8J3E7J4_9PROT|nr:haloacid dehalogenase type II [Aliidongia dinghuensis]GGF42451.1 haloacid dehalogenase [Aliidongia dinghuensis]